MSKTFNGIIESLDINLCNAGPLSGKSFVAKDLFDVAGYVTGAGNPDWKRTHKPASKHAAAVQQLLDAGARLIGKSCTDELAFSLDGINVHFGTPVNTSLPGHIPGGSSSGSASAVAAGLCDFAIGTDTAGSIRVPSAFCGIYGIRPTHGRISVSGVVPLGPSFDTVGWMSQSADILAQVGSVLLGGKARQSELPSSIVLVTNSMELLHEQLQEPFEDACSHILDLKSLDSISLPVNALEDWSLSFNTIRSYEAWQQHGEWMQQTDPQMAEPIKKRFLACAKTSRSEFENAVRERDKAVEWLQALLSARVLCVPAIWNWAPELTAPEEELANNRKKNLFLNSIASFGGLPQIVIPATIPGASSKFAISLIAGAGMDLALLALAQRTSNVRFKEEIQ